LVRVALKKEEDVKRTLLRFGLAILWVGLGAPLGATAFAQEGPPGAGPHAPPEDARGAVGDGEEEEEDGPNLQIPESVQGKDRKDLEQAIALWKSVYAGLGTAKPDVTKLSLDKAIDDLEALRKRLKGCALPSHYLGIAYQIRGFYFDRAALETAVHRLKAATRLLPNFHEALVELADAHGHVGKERDSEIAYDKAIAAKPDYALAYRRRASLLLGLGRFEEARSDVRVARKLQPKDESLEALERKFNLVIDGPDWPVKYEVETKNYVVRTNVSQEFAQSIADQSELIRRLYGQVFPRRKSKRKSPIVVFRSKQEYHASGGPPSAGGHFDPLFKQLFLFKYPKHSDTRLVLYHEGFHQYLDGILEVKPPQWFNEGVADFFGPSIHHKVKGEEGMKIQPNPWRLKTIQRIVRSGQAVPFERLMTMTQQEMYGRDAGKHYAQAWSMIYFFAEADDRVHFKYIKSYFKSLRRGKDRMQAYESAFGKANMQALQDRWREFILRVKL
jgi:tetratricopeptide (TPR) repeat protein